MIGTNASTNENHEFYKSTVQAILRGVGYCAKRLELYAPVFLHGSPRKTQV